MKRLLLYAACRVAPLVLVLALYAGCSMVRELKAPPFPYTVIAHSRVIGVNATIPNQAGDAVFKFQFGIVTQTLQLIPCSTNKLFIPTISDDFVFGQTFSFYPDTSVKESLQTGWDGPPPPLRLNIFKEPFK